MNEPLECIELTVSEEETIAAVPGENRGRPLLAPAVTVGRLCAVITGAGPFVDFPGNDSGDLISARTAVRVHEEQVGSDVALAFEDGDPSRPIILGVLQNPMPRATQSAEPKRLPASSPSEEDPESLLITAARQITLRCGKASITLTNAGKLLIKGEYVVSHSSGVNKVRGGSVQIN